MPSPPPDLAQIFATQAQIALPWDTAPGSADQQVLHGHLLQLAEMARSAWPGVDLSPADLAEALAGRLSAEQAARGPATCCDGLHIGDVYLAAACARGLPAAVDAFERELITRVPALVSHLRQPPEFADELQQILRERLLVGDADTGPRIQQYRGHGSLSAWFSSVTVRTALSLLRTPHQAVPFEEAHAPELVDTNPAVRLLRERHGAAFHEALRSAFAQLTPEQRNLLRMYHGEHLNIPQMAAIFGVNKSTVTRWLAAARGVVLDTTRRLLAERLGIDGSELSSVIRALCDRFDVSLGGALRADDPPRGSPGVSG